jgi:hypothetical protein
MVFKNDLFDTLNTAIQLHKAIVIVEGKDDYQIYQNIANHIGATNIEVYQADEFEDFESGCRGVIACIEKLQPKFDERIENINKILGVIDRDVRQFREGLPTYLNGLFITKHYSIETYFATPSNLQKLINKITFTTSRDVGYNILELVEGEFNNFLPDLYLLSLEALKNACIENYNKNVCYDDAESKISNRNSRTHLLGLLQPKESELQIFAEEKGISRNDVKLIAKGKWYLFSYAFYTYPIIKELQNKCRNSEIIQCRSCNVGNYDTCLYKIKAIYTTQQLCDDLLGFIDENECADIITAFQKLG